MDFKQVLLGTLAGTVVLFGLSMLIFGTLGVGEMINSGSSAESCSNGAYNPAVIALSYLSSALLLTVVYTRWAKISTFMGGAKAGLWIGALIGIIVQADYLFLTNITSASGVAIYAVCNGLITAIAGGVIGWVLGYLNKA